LTILEHQKVPIFEHFQALDEPQEQKSHNPSPGPISGRWADFFFFKIRNPQKSEFSQ